MKIYLIETDVVEKLSDLERTISTREAAGWEFFSMTKSEEKKWLISFKISKGDVLDANTFTIDGFTYVVGN
jgi:hypothetical protein